MYARMCLQSALFIMILAAGSMRALAQPARAGDQADPRPHSSVELFSRDGLIALWG